MTTLGLFVRSDSQAVYDRSEGLEKQNLSNGFVSWSPDGRRLAAVSLPGAFSGSIWVVEPESLRPFRKLLDLTAGGQVRGMSWAAMARR
jgi:hypothetical protein